MYLDMDVHNAQQEKLLQVLFLVRILFLIIMVAVNTVVINVSNVLHMKIAVSVMRDIIKTVVIVINAEQDVHCVLMVTYAQVVKMDII